MIPKNLTIAGSLGILAGLNRDTLTLNLDDIIPSDAITIAIKGDNGSGKSTLFNLAFTPWRNPPMLGSAGLYGEFGPTGLRELEFTHAGIRYRSRIEIKQTDKTKSQKSYLHVLVNDAWQPVTLPDNTTSDGKASTYDACLSYLLGPQSLYYLSAFRAQNAPKLAEYSDAKELMQDLLALGEPKALRELSKDVSRDINREYLHLRDDIEALKDKASEADNTALLVSTCANEIPALSQSQDNATMEHSQAKAALDKAVLADADDAVIRKARASIEERINAEHARLRRTTTQTEEAIRVAAIDLTNIEPLALSRKKQRDDRARKINTRITDARAVLSNSEKIKNAAEAAIDVAAQIVAGESDLNAARVTLTQLQQVVADLQSLQTKSRVLLEQITQGKRRSEFIVQVPCHGKGVYAECPALKDAHQASDALPGMNAKLDDVEQQIDDAQAKITAFGDPASSVQQHEDGIANTRAILADLQELAAQQPILDQAQGIIDDAMEAITSLNQDATNDEESTLEQTTKITDRIATLKAQKYNHTGDSESIQTELSDELGRLPKPDKESIVADAQTKLSDANQALTDKTQALTDKQAQLAEAKASLGALKAGLVAGQQIKARGNYLAEELAIWRMLSFALQGTIDLTIEDSGPSIAATANQLLADAYGPRFTLAIVTQREQANGKLVECFDISVTDSESGLTSSALKKSGGESVWIDKALTDAVGIHYQDVAAVDYECRFTDESEDGLRTERKAQLYRMDRAALKLSGCQRKFSISHDAEYWEQADAVIDMDALRC